MKEQPIHEAIEVITNLNRTGRRVIDILVLFWNIRTCAHLTWPLRRWN